MKGIALLFMLIFWMFIVSLVTFCFTLLLFNPKEKKKVSPRSACANEPES